MTIVKAHGNNSYILDGQCHPIIQMALTFVTFIQIWLVMDRSYIHPPGESHPIIDGINNCYSGW